MKLTAFTDYSLRVLMFLAADPARKATIAEVAAAFDVSEHHLTKVIHFLGQRGWLSTQRGKHGGVMLARPAAAILVGQVVRDTEGQALPAACFSATAGDCVIAGCCGLRGVLEQALQAFYAVLDRTTLADITGNRPALAALLHFQTVRTRPVQSEPAQARPVRIEPTPHRHAVAED